MSYMCTAAVASAFLMLLSTTTAVYSVESLLGQGMSRTAAPENKAAQQAGTEAEATQQAMDPLFAGTLQAHNRYRRIHGALPLVWNAQVAASAARWATACKWGHPSITENGQNIAAYNPGNDASGSLLRAITDWYAEEKDYDYNTYGPQNGNPVLHFTQVVWRRTQYLGCAVTYCTNLVRLDNGEPAFPSGALSGDYVVCEYAPAGNYDGDFANNVLPPGSSVDPPDVGGSGSPSPAPASPGPGTVPTPEGNNYLIEGSRLTSGGECLTSSNDQYTMCLNQRGQLVTKLGPQVTWTSAKRGAAKRAPYQLVFVGKPKPNTVVVQDKRSKQLMTVVTFTRTVVDNINRPVALVLGDDGALYVWEKGNCLKRFTGMQSAC